jgi:hypothetical protein
MPASNYFICCEQCFEAIGRRNTNAARLWMDLCAMRLATSEVFTLKTSDFPELRILETLGFVVSTEKPQSLAIRLKGHMNTVGGEDFFCVKAGRHE